MEEATSMMSLTIAASFIAAIMAFAIILFALLYSRRKTAHSLELSALEVKKQKDLLNAQIKSSDDERNRIASLLHDDVNNQLTLFKMQLRQLPQKEIRAALNLEIDNIITQLRNLSHELSTEQIRRFGLLNEIDSMKRRLSDQHIELQDHHIHFLNELSKDQQVHLYRILQELIGNSLKHGKAKNLHLTINKSNHSLEVNYEDDGLGFQPEELEHIGLGTKNIQSRVQQLKAESFQKSSPGKGFKFNLIIPQL